MKNLRQSLASGIVCAAIPFLILLSGCGKSNQGMPPGGITPEVSVVTLVPRRVEITTELPGRTSPYRIADVRPQVSGIILKRMFAEGSEVQEGEQLYQIDPAPYEAALANAQGTLGHNQAVLAYDKIAVTREVKLIKSDVISQDAFDQASANYSQALADVATAQAAVQTAQINLLYTKVLSPISGRTGRSSVTEGALVTTGQTNPLVTVQQLNPIYVDITQPTSELLRLQRELAEGKLQKAGSNEATAQLTLEDGSRYPETGTVQFSEVTVDQGTASVTLRAVFPNPNRQLLPGMFVHAILKEGFNNQALLVPQRGITHNQKGDPTALVVGDDGKVELRPLKADRAIGDAWLVTDGLKPGDKVIVEGLQKVMPGATVHAVEFSDAGTPPPQ
jgi:membrane fusion protein (multidrug efflux system)